jgi:hypothetical protein
MWLRRGIGAGNRIAEADYYDSAMTPLMGPYGHIRCTNGILSMN